MNRFLKNPGACARAGNPTLIDLTYGWGNVSWASNPEYLADCIDHALTTPGPILECGSGLSTILLGAVARIGGQTLWALEHQAEWGAKVRRVLRRYKLDCVTLSVTPLKDHGEFCWYDAPLESMPRDFALVVCDGPPGHTKGGRYGLLPIMRPGLRPGCVILLDDTCREEEVAIARRWEAELNTSFSVRGVMTSHIRMTIPEPKVERT